MLTDWTDVLLLHLLRCPKTIERLAGKLEPEDVSTATMDNTKGFLWKGSRDYYLQHSKPIPQYLLIAQLADLASAGALSPDEIDAIGALVDFIFSIEEKDLNYETAMDYAKRLLEQVRVQTPVQDMLHEGVDVAKIYEAFQTGLNAATVSMPEPIDTLAEWQKMLGCAKPVPVGGQDVMYFNNLVNGGLIPGEIVVILGPMGGFKTTVAIDLVCSLALLKEYSAYLSYEQSYQGGDLPFRFMARLSGVDRDLLMNSIVDQLSDEHKRAMDEAMVNYSKYALFFDQSQSRDTIADIAAIVRKLESEGKKPKLMVIDQLMTWMNMWPEASGAKDDWFRKESTNTIVKLKKQICEKFGINMIVLHQITAGSIGKQGGKDFAHTESAENKGLGFYADFVLTIGTKSEGSNVFKMVAGKTRRGPSGHRYVQAIPSVCKFKDVTNDWVEDDKRPGHFVQKGSKTMIPTVLPPGKIHGAPAADG